MVKRIKYSSPHPQFLKRVKSARDMTPEEKEAGKKELLVAAEE